MTGNKRVGLIGRVDPGETMMDGQTVKTRTLHRCLTEHLGASRVLVVDTLDYRHRALRIMIDLLRCLWSCDDIIVLLSDNGRKVIFPILAAASRHRGKRIFHSLIGGRLADQVQADRSGRLARQLSAFEINWVESRLLVRRLRRLGVDNASYLPNFKDLGPLGLRASPPANRPHRLCTFSRVTPEKGIANAVRSVTQINRRAGRCVVELDVFGPVEPSYETEFRRLLNEAPEARYAGCVAAEHSVRAICDYDALLFPTEWIGEGMPGTIIDAMSASLPVVASRWTYYGEMLQDGVTGLGYDFDRPEQLRPTIEEFLALPAERVEAMRRASFTRSRQYAPEAVFCQVARALAGSAR